MSKVARSLLAGLLLFSPMVAIGEQELSVTVTPLKGGLHLLTGLGGNVVASVGYDGVLLIDADYSQYAPSYEKALLSLGMKEAPRFVLNTHWHGDHTGSNSYWGERGSVIIAHNNVLQRMSTRQEMKTLGRVVEPSPRAALPVVTFEQGLALHFNNDDIEMQYFPRAHTDGDSIIFFARENVVHMGDHFFNGRFPFVDFGSGGSLQGYIDNVDAVLSRIDEQTIVVPGHGLVGNKADLVRFHTMILTTSKIVTDKLAQGLSVEAIIEGGLGDQWAAWGQNFIKEAAWISFLAHPPA
jgi:glyoxylase-like metal-dependent hydrolase (beta-lactamase superfamily II)